MEKKELVIDGITYIPKNSVQLSKPAKSLKGKPYVIIRTYSAGVFAGYLDKRVGKEATLLNVRRLWFWKGAASLSQLARDGVKNPDECKFAVEVSKIEVTEVIEVLEVTEKARNIIQGVKAWEN